MKFSELSFDDRETMKRENKIFHSHIENARLMSDAICVWPKISFFHSTLCTKTHRNLDHSRAYISNKFHSVRWRHKMLTSENTFNSILCGQPQTVRSHSKTNERTRYSLTKLNRKLFLRSTLAVCVTTNPTKNRFPNDKNESESKRTDDATHWDASKCL